LRPGAGDVVSAPFAVAYQLDNAPNTRALRLTLGDGGGFALVLPTPTRSGVVYLDDNRLSGRRTLVFTALGANEQPLTNGEATVRIPNVVIEGGK
jgi:hypothetical protein